MFRRFNTEYNFVNDKGERQTIPRGWAGEVSDAVAKAADEAGVTQRLDDKGKVIPAAGSTIAGPQESPVSEAKVAAPAPTPAPTPAITGAEAPGVAHETTASGTGRVEPTRSSSGPGSRSGSRTG